MKGLLEVLAGFGMAAVALIGVSVVYGLAMGDTQADVMPHVTWGVVILAFSLLFAGVVKRWGAEAQLNDSRSGEDSVPGAPRYGRYPPDSETARRVVAALALGGRTAMFARQWAGAYEKDHSVPLYGARPYWTPTGPGGAPELLSIVGLKGAGDRLRVAREVELENPLLAIMADDPAMQVRDLVSARLRG